jgi:hypothetical protein
LDDKNDGKIYSKYGVKPGVEIYVLTDETP